MSWFAEKADCGCHKFIRVKLSRGVRVVKRSLFVIISCMFISLPSLADFHGHGDGYTGGIGNSTRLNGYYDGDGGEFTLYGNNLTLSNSAYDSSTSGLGGYSESLQTFCLEKDENTYNPSKVWVSTEYVNGDPGSHAYRGGENTDWGDNLDSRTAYLYTQFAAGELSKYNYNVADGRSNSAKQLQKAIWYIEGEISELNNSSQAWKWVQEAYNAIETDKWVGIGDVRVIQMYGDPICGGYSYKQDFIYLETRQVPAPAAVILGFLGMAVAGLKLRKFA